MKLLTPTRVAGVFAASTVLLQNVPAAKACSICILADGKRALFANNEAPKRESIQNQLKAFGDLVSLTLVDRGEEAGKRVYWYRLGFKNARIIQRFVLDDHDRLAEVEVQDLQQ